MKKVSIAQTDTAAWVADQTIGTDLERTGLITRIDFTVEVTPSATLAGANTQDGLFRLFQNMRVIGGSHTYLTFPADDGCEGGGVLQHYLSQLDGFGYGHAEGSVSAPNTAYTAISWPFHLGSRPKDMYGRDNPFDLTAFINAEGESQLRAEWTVASNDVMDDTVTIASAVGVFTLHRILGTQAEIRTEMARQGVVLPVGATGMVPAWTAINHANQGTTTDFDAETINIPMGAWLKRISFIVQDATATRTLRAGDELTEFSINSPRTNERLLQHRTESQFSDALKASIVSQNSGGANSVDGDTSTDFDAHRPAGFHYVDFRPRTDTPLGQDYGIDLRGFQTGDLTLGLLLTTRAAGDDVLMLSERYQATNLPVGF